MARYGYQHNVYAIDCEMVDVEEAGSFKQFPIQVVIVNENYHIVYNRYIRPEGRVVNSKSHIHGINLDMVMWSGIPIKQAQKNVQDLLYNSIVVGHDLDHDLRSLDLQNLVPSYLRRDTATASMFIVRQPSPSRGWQKPSLASLARQHLNTIIQNGIHDPVEDAKTAMQLYNKFKHCSPSSWAAP